MSSSIPYAIILAGGKGTRLWPLSRRSTPKHVMPLPLKGGLTMVQSTLQRLRKGLPLDHIYISTTTENYQEIRHQLPIIPVSQICIEYGRKGTGVGIALTALTIRRRNPDAIVVSINCDAYVGNEQHYRKAIHRSARVAQAFEDQIVLVGIPPAYPDTGLGYIVVHPTPIKIVQGTGRVFSVQRFVEKPTIKNAQKLLATKRAYWNPTLIVARVATLWNAYVQHCPAQTQILESLVPLRGPLPSKHQQQKLFSRLKPISIEYDILERQKNLLMVDGGNIGWADIGQWRTVMEILAHQKHSSMVSIGHHVDYKSKNSLVYNTTSALVTTVKLSNIILIITNDVILAVDKHYAQDVKAIVALLEQRGWKQYT